jgi:hypothetical protein
MDDYINKFDSFNKIIVYNFESGWGGIGDYIKFFMFVLESCIKNNTRLYYKKNNLETEKYIKLKYDKMYIEEDNINQLGCVEIVQPQMYYTTVTCDYSIDIKDVFYFTDEVKINCNKLFPADILSYTSIHLRLGDKYLETDMQFIECKEDVRTFSEEKIHNFIEENHKTNLFFCCDNNNYKLKIKEKYDNITITNCDIGHTSLCNTTKQQVLDGITEFYILSNSELIYAASYSGFSLMASKINKIPLIIC